MPAVDDEIRRRLRRAAPSPGEVQGLFDTLVRRKRRRAAWRRAGTVGLVLAVLIGTVGGFLLADRARRDDVPAVTPTASNGALVVTDADGHLSVLPADKVDLNPADGAAASVADLVPLTDTADVIDTDPAVSPDGRTVAFIRVLGDPSEAAELWTIGIDGTEERRLARGNLLIGSVSWSPDGRWIAIHGALPNSIWFIHPDGTGFRQVSIDRFDTIDDPSWSTGDARIIFSGESSDGASDLWSVSPDGSDLVQLTFTPNTVERSPVASPDGRWIGFDTDDGIWRMPAGGGAAVSAVPAATVADAAIGQDGGAFGQPGWSPDGSTLTFVIIAGGTSTIYALPADGSYAFPLAPGTSYAWQPIPEGSTPPPGPQVRPEGRNIGLGTNICQDERLDGLDLVPGGPADVAWTGHLVRDDGTCPERNINVQRWVVAIDVTGDGRADASSPIPLVNCPYVGCSPLGATDLDADGDQELVVMTQFSILDQGYFAVSTAKDGEVTIDPILVAEPGHPAAGIDPGVPLTTSAAGDEGYASWIRCESYPAAPVLVFTYVSAVVESEKPAEWHEVKLQLQGDGRFHVIDATDLSLPPGDDPGLIRSEAPACGLDFNIWARPNP